MEKLKDYIRNIPDFPKRGILFRDITTLLKEGKIFKKVIDKLARYYKDKGIERVVVIESRGFVIGSALAYKLGAGVVLIRKKGKLPARTVSIKYQLEYGFDTLEMHYDAITPGMRVLIVDDLLATGGTARATLNLVKKRKGKVVGFCFLIELTDLKGRRKLKGYDVYSLIKY